MPVNQRSSLLYQPNRLLIALLIFPFFYAACAAGAPSEGSKNPFAYRNNLFRNTVKINAVVKFVKPGEPSFSWPATGYKHVVCEVVWLWHTGLGTGREGNVLFEHGIPGPNKKGPVSALKPGTYYWGVWAFDDHGRPAFSSVENSFEVKP